MKSDQLTFKPKFYSRSIWRRLFLLQLDLLLTHHDRFIFTRKSIIPRPLQHFKLYIYNGLIWIPRFINKYVIGFRFGELTWNRKLALYKAKHRKKKK